MGYVFHESRFEWLSEEGYDAKVKVSFFFLEKGDGVYLLVRMLKVNGVHLSVLWKEVRIPEELGEKFMVALEDAYRRGRFALAVKEVGKVKVAHLWRDYGFGIAQSKDGDWYAIVRDCLIPLWTASEAQSSSFNWEDRSYRSARLL